MTYNSTFQDRAAQAAEATFEQSYSADGGLTWETNWLATDTRR